ncbi:putative Pentatricopeptide repeat-containing protein [Zostera marina]|uniref:Putative Pentatricopeptide repeat-containing protein n=1 Tax=Zostera marina TaxID=29655 RepID=A0A0K9NUJ7_ZOSMR|nr:putative Pentatricopeptide repeat-containing protein [Zostera marina]
MLTSPFFSILKIKRTFSSVNLPPFSDNRKLLAGILQTPVSVPHLLQTHARIFRLNVHNDNLIATRLIGRHQPHFALCILNNLHSPNIFPYNAAIRILSESSSLASSAFEVYNSLKLRDVFPNDFTFSFLLKACSRCGDVRSLWQVHGQVLKLGFGSDESVVGGLLSGYGKGVDDIFSAHKLFDEMSEKGDAGWLWTCLIAGYARMNKPDQALVLFLKMIDEGVDPTDDTMVSVLSSCSRITEIEKWIDRFSKIRSTNQRAAILGDSIDTVLIYLYGKSEERRDEGALLLFREMKSSGRRLSVVTWNAMISFYIQTGSPHDALELFDEMIRSNSNPNHVTIVSVLSACSQVGNLELGKWAHEYMNMKSSHGRRLRDALRSNTILATAFIDMYSKCGSLEAASQVFSRIMVQKDTVIFNAMITGLSINGRGKQAIQLFYQMRKLGVQPNEATFLGLLSGCVHSGLIRQGEQVFKSMHQVYSMRPNLEHYSCYVDLLGRGGRVEEAAEVIRRMGMEPNEQVWGALVGGCVTTETARSVARRVVDLDPGRSGGYVMLSNVYAGDLRWGEIAGLRGAMKEKGVRKQPGCSWISLDGSMHCFFVGCRSHHRIHDILLALQNLYNEMQHLEI